MSRLHSLAKSPYDYLELLHAKVSNSLKCTLKEQFLKSLGFNLVIDDTFEQDCEVLKVLSVPPLYKFGLHELLEGIRSDV